MAKIRVVSHSPGPWRCWNAFHVPGNRVAVERIGPDGGGELQPNDGYSIVATEADAVLACSAPVLLSVLEELVAIVEQIMDGSYTPDSYTLQPAKNAILQAKTVIVS